MSRLRGTRAGGGDFDESTIEAVWKKAEPEPGYTYFRRDVCGASIHHARYGTTDAWGWEIDHIKPVAKGGTDDVSNLQPLYWENNRHKGDDWPAWTCRVRANG